MRTVLAIALTLGATSPAFAASGPFLSMSNTNFVVLLGFLLFVGILLFVKVPGLLGGQLDARAEGIQSELDEARALREEAQTILASYERKQQEVQAQADRIVAAAREDAAAAAEDAKEELAASIARRLAAAEEQITSAQAAAVNEVRDQAISIAVAAADRVIAKQMTATEANKLIEASIADVNAKLH